MKRSRKPITFAIIGAANTALDFGILFLLKLLGFPAIIANIFSTSIAFVFSFFMNRKYTFKTTGGNIKRELVLFILVTLFGLWVLQSLVIWFTAPLIQNLGISENTVVLLAKLAATVVSLVWNYIMYDRVVFKNKEQL